MKNNNTDKIIILNIIGFLLCYLGSHVGINNLTFLQSFISVIFFTIGAFFVVIAILIK